MASQRATKLVLQLLGLLNLTEVLERSGEVPHGPQDIGAAEGDATGAQRHNARDDADRRTKIRSESGDEALRYRIPLGEQMRELPCEIGSAWYDTSKASVTPRTDPAGSHLPRLGLGDRPVPARRG